MRIEFLTDSAAFCNSQTGEEDKYYRNAECLRVLNNVKMAFSLDGKESGTILDSNGNAIGHWEF